MDHEIERKFFFDPAHWSQAPSRTIPWEQGYLPGTGDWELRLRRSGTEHRYTMKTGTGLDRGEWELKISAEEFDALWSRTEGCRLVKVRKKYSWKGATLEVDTYAELLEGLTVAEVEFPSVEAARKFSVHRAMGPELTYDPRYKNRALAAGAEVPRFAPGVAAPGWSFGVLPFRKGPKGWELVIVSTRRNDRWIFPKGQPEPGLSPEKVALIEAREEAGLTGKVSGHPFVLPYVRENTTTNLLLFPLQVTSLADRWLEVGQRERKIIPVDEAGGYGELVKVGAQWLRDHRVEGPGKHF